MVQLCLKELWTPWPSFVYNFWTYLCCFVSLRSRWTCHNYYSYMHSKNRLQVGSLWSLGHLVPFRLNGFWGVTPRFPHFCFPKTIPRPPHLLVVLTISRSHARGSWGSSLPFRTAFVFPWKLARIMTREHPQVVTWRIQPLWGLIQATWIFHCIWYPK